MQILTPFPRCDLISHVNSRKCPCSVGLLIQAIDCYTSCRKCQIHWLRICWVQLPSLWHWESLQWICR